MKHATQDFFQRLQWEDFHGAAEVIVEEQRDAFLENRERQHDERDLSISDYEIERMKLATDGLSATCWVRIWWTRLPSPTQEQTIVQGRFVWRAGQWRVASIQRGPIVFGASADAGTPTSDSP